MAKHVKLPDNDTPKKSKPPETPVAIDPVQAIRDRATLVLPEDEHAYVLRLKLMGSALAGIVLMTHKKKFSTAEVTAMINEAVKICNETRIPERRKQMAEQKTPIEDPVRINETWFEGDIDFVEAVMSDKFQFRKLLYLSVGDEIIPTIKV